ncbi:hypothetical protein K469DRAFT_715049 [Zopfia rhizophila CBS 207.26]|uniref:FAD-binding FR-type domain-containing protein n=1 Tax=Zopfia rhizophila CBS 207.26 TaxID=1314779 RepID=A0A6A6EPV9_9PEZI|nr:hypothetical protein K469DRAFT_715049 [Zopfia rhizophila CBS 207.26]
MAFSLAMSWNPGEEQMHKRLHVPDHDNPTSSMLTPQASFMLQRAPLLAIGTLDSQKCPWTTLWGGTPGFSQPLGGGIIGTRTIVDGVNDPVVQGLVGGSEKGEMVQGDANGDGIGRMVSGLAIDLMTRKRVKIFGRMIAGSLGEVDVEFPEGAERTEGAPEKQDQLQLVTKIEQSLGNCPKYLNQYELRPAFVTSKLLAQSAELNEEAQALVQKADMFFLSSSTDEDMDTNHRGGPPGFVRIISPTEIAYPEYSGNRLYQTLGNLQMNPKVGVTFPDYETGNILYITGTVEILVASDAANLLPGSNLALKIKIEKARLVEGGQPFRGTKKVPSPYNPLVRTLASEGNIKSRLSDSSSHKTATLIKKSSLTPTISRYTFKAVDSISYSPGQWAALDFSRDMDYGYSHMRNDDPRSLNDDFVRTFTISSSPSPSQSKATEFNITIREVGPVTSHLFKQNDRAGFEVPILGVGGDFSIKQEEGKTTPFIAGGVGITPLLGHLPSLILSPESFKLFWTVRSQDINLVHDTVRKYPDLAKCTTVFLTRGDVRDGEQLVRELEGMGLKIEKRRVEKKDLEGIEAETWYLCAAKGLRKEILAWLEGKKAVFEDFDY